MLLKSKLGFIVLCYGSRIFDQNVFISLPFEYIMVNCWLLCKAIGTALGCWRIVKNLE
jgi:hypothetical protein